MCAHFFPRANIQLRVHFFVGSLPRGNSLRAMYAISSSPILKDFVFRPAAKPFLVITLINLKQDYAKFSVILSEKT